jgi:putative spermidine/putrescine transport system ATP-binding protein
MFPLEVRKLSKAEAEEKVTRALAMVRMEEFGNRRPAQLSGGQQQRIAVARALVFEPRLVLMDEPLGALDKQLREEMQYEIKHIHESLGVTVVYVTHDQSEALTMSNRIAVFNDGVVQQLATPEELYEYPENAFVAQFIGENNRLLGEVKRTDGNTCHVEVLGQQIEALSVAHAGVGSKTTLSLRPERVLISPEAGSVPNVFDARVEEQIYLGDHMRTRFSLCGSDQFIVKVPNSAGHQHLRPGEQVKVGWHAEDCRALDAS